MAGGLQLAQATFSLGEPDPDEILVEKDDGQDDRQRSKI